MKENEFPFLIGQVIVQTDLSLIQLGESLSQKLLHSFPLSGLDDCIYEEIPAIYCRILGLQIVLSQENENKFCFSVAPRFSRNLMENIEVKLSHYLFLLLEETYKNDTRIKVLQN